MTLDGLWIRAERSSASDEEMAVNDYLVADGQQVRSGEAVAEIEGAKSVVEVEAPEAGFFYAMAAVGDRLEIGAPLGFLSPTQLDSPPTAGDMPRDERAESPEAASAQHRDGLPATDSAIALAAELGVDVTAITGVELITSDVVRQVHGSSASAAPQSLPSRMTRIVILGGGNGAIQVREAALSNSNLAIVGVLDDRNNSLEPLGVPTLGPLDQDVALRLYQAGSFDGVVLSISSRMDLRAQWREFCASNGIPMVSVVHQRAFIAPSAQIGAGSLIMDSARVGAYARLDENVFVSAGTDIEHHCVVGADTTFGPGVFLSGGVTIGSSCVFGSVIAVEPGVTIGAHSIVASGSVLTSDVPERSIVKLATGVKIRPRS